MQNAAQGLEINLAEDEEKFRILAEVTASAIFICQGTRLRYVNPATEQLTGFGRDELYRMTFLELLQPDSRKVLRSMWNRLRKGQDRSLQSELRLVTKTGEERWINLTTSLIYHLSQPAMVGTAFDITARKRAELLQDAVYRIAQAADRSKSLADLFPSIHAIIDEVMTARNFYIALYDRDADVISYPYYVDEYDPPAEPHKPGKGLTEWILNHGKSILFDVETQARMEGAGEVVLVGSPSLIWLGVPLCLDTDVIGVMAVQDYSNAAAYGARELRMLEFVSSQVAMAIQRKRAENALQASEAHSRQRASEMAALFETTRDLVTQRDLASLLQTIVTRAVSLVGSSAGAIFLHNEGQNELELAVAHGAQMQPYIGTLVSPGEGITGQAAEVREPVFVNDHRQWAGRSQKFDSLPITAAVSTPMIYSGELVGVLTVYALADGKPSDVRAFTQTEADLLTFFAGVAASAVHNARLFDETRQRLAELELLYQASLAASQIHSPHAVAQRIVDTLDHQLNWKGSIWVVEDQTPVLLAYGSKGLLAEQHKQEIERIKGLIRTLEDGIVGWVCKNGVALRTGDVRRNFHYIASNSIVMSEMCVPLKSGGKTIGCINMESEQQNAFSEHDERLLTTLANQAAIAIENARLFEETRRRAVRQSALNTIIVTATHAGLDLESLLNTTLDQILKALGLDMGTAWVSGTPHKFQRVAARGVPPSLSLMMNNAALMGSISLEKTLVVQDWETENHVFSDTLVQMGLRSAIVAPLLADGLRIGGLAIVCPQPRQWTAEEIAFVDAAAGELGAAAERARLFEETRLRLTELEAVNRVSAALRQAQSVERMLPDLLDEILKTLSTDAGSIWLYDKEQGKLRQAVGRGWCTRVAHLELKPGVGIPGIVYSSGDILFSHDIALDPLTPIPVRELASAGWSAVCVPICLQQETIGVLLVSTQLPREFDGENARLLATFSDMAGSAIHRMELNEQTRRHADELEERVASRTAELRQALEKAQEVDRLKSEFIANINHELRTPLTNLVLYSQMLRAQPTVKTQERLDVIGRELQRLRSLIENLLNLSRLDLGQIHFNPAEHDLNSVIRPIVEDRRSLAEERRLTLAAEFQPNLPAVSFDEALLVQVVSNLLTNALNYTPPGGRVWVRTMYTVDGDQYWVGFSVEDTGPGIADEERERLFERFYRGKVGHTSGASGTGLGLAIVKQVVDRHAGRIEVPKSAPGKGAIFRVWLPAQKKETA